MPNLHLPQGRGLHLLIGGNKSTSVFKGLAPVFPWGGGGGRRLPERPAILNVAELQADTQLRVLGKFPRISVPQFPDSKRRNRNLPHRVLRG